jgi:multiple sugar transport system permease protein
MSIARAIRLLLAFASLLIVVWAFIFVGNRAVRRWRGEQQRPITLTVLHWGDKAEDEVVEKLCNRYMNENPRVQIVRINGGADFRSKLKTMMAAGTPPDLFYMGADIFPQLAPLGVLRPIDDLVEADRKAGTFTWYDDFYPVILDAFRYDRSTGLTGKGPLYGLPKDFTTLCFYVNVDLFEKAGVPIPYGGWTWDEFEATVKKIRALDGTPGFEGRTIYGGMFDIWPDTLRNVVWTFGGDFFGPGGFKDVTLDHPAAQEAIQFIARLRLLDKTVYNATGIAKEGGQEFINGNIGCLGPVGRWKVARYTLDMKFRWDCVPIPRKKPGLEASQIFTTAWAMSSRTPHVQECYELQKFLCGPEGGAMNSRLGVAIPPLKHVANGPAFLDPPVIPKHNAQVFLDAIAYARLQQTPPQTEWTDIVSKQTPLAIQLPTPRSRDELAQITMNVAKSIERDWLAELSSPLRQKQWQPIRWNTIVTITLALIAALIAALWVKARREKLGPLDRAQERAGFAFVAPWLIGFIVLTAGPMIASLLLSFSKWTAMTPITDAQSVGTANYRQLFGADRTFFQSLKVTLYFVLLAVPITQIAALAVAMLMNVRVRGIALFRTIYFVPSVVSGVALAVLWLQIFNNDYGLLNSALRPVTRHLLGSDPPDWFGREAHAWAVPAFVIMGLWGVGGGMIIYLAGLKGIPASLYEAATVDGAGPMRKFWNVTLPMLSPLIFYNLVMGIIGSFQVFTQAKVMTNGGPNDATLFYVLNLYRQAFEFHNMGYASAMAWVLFLIVLVLTILVFRASRNLVYYEGLKA